MRVSDLTYGSVGLTRDADWASRVPQGFRPYESRTPVGHGDAAWGRATDALLRWEVQLRSGIRVTEPATISRDLEAGDTVVMRVPLWPRDVPCRVVYTVREPDRRGFAYGTLPGHPERGEEAFLLERDPTDGAVHLTIRAFSRPSSLLFWVGYPGVRLMQHVYTRRYERALQA